MSPGTTEVAPRHRGSSTADMFAVGDNGTILHSNNDGFTWAQQTSGTTRNLDAVFGSGPNDVFAVGLNGTIQHTGNDGALWPPSFGDHAAAQRRLGEQLDRRFRGGRRRHDPALQLAPEAPVTTRPRPRGRGRRLPLGTHDDEPRRADRRLGLALAGRHHPVHQLRHRRRGPGRRGVRRHRRPPPWEHSPVRPAAGLETSTGSFQQISAGVNGAGQAVVFGVLTNNSLWERTRPTGPA